MLWNQQSRVENPSQQKALQPKNKGVDLPDNPCSPATIKSTEEAQALLGMVRSIGQQWIVLILTQMVLYQSS